MKKNLLALLVLLSWALIFGTKVRAQDSCVFNNGDYVTGAVESMDRGIMVFSTDYSDQDFTIEWEKIKYLETTTTFIVALENSTESLGTLKSSGPERMSIISKDGNAVKDVSIHEIVYLNPISNKFLDRLSARIDLGYSKSKANDLMQFNVNAGLGYEAPVWSTEIAFSSMMTSQEDVEPIRRNEGVFNLTYNLPMKLFGIATVNMLSNTEQDLELRTNTQLGAGIYLFRTNKAYWSAKGGSNYNVERFEDPAINPDNESWEGLIGTDFNLYDIGDLDFRYQATFYPGISEKGRWRADMGCEFRYKFLSDLYISAGFTLNWDNMPATGTAPIDYVYNMGFGWKW